MLFTPMTYLELACDCDGTAKHALSFDEDFKGRLRSETSCEVSIEKGDDTEGHPAECAVGILKSPLQQGVP
jgi:hypothetical protein